MEDGSAWTRPNGLWANGVCVKVACPGQTAPIWHLCRVIARHDMTPIGGGCKKSYCGLSNTSIIRSVGLLQPASAISPFFHRALDRDCVILILENALLDPNTRDAAELSLSFVEQFVCV